MHIWDSRDYFSEVADAYLASEASPRARLWRTHDLAMIHSATRRTPKHLLIDVGAGPCGYGADLSSLFRRCIAIDFSLTALVVSRRSDSAPRPLLVCADIRDLCCQLRDVSLFLAVGASLCYQPDALDAALRVAAESLAPAGVFYFEVWNATGGAKRPDAEWVMPSRCRSSFQVEAFDTKRAVRFTYSERRVAAKLASCPLTRVDCFGRRCLEAFWPRTLVDLLTSAVPRLMLVLERAVCRLPAARARAPKLIFVLSKEPQ